MTKMTSMRLFRRMHTPQILQSSQGQLFPSHELHTHPFLDRDFCNFKMTRNNEPLNKQLKYTHNIIRNCFNQVSYESETTCNESSGESKTLHEGSENVENSDQLATCPICLKSLPSKKILRSHLARRHAPTISTLLRKNALNFYTNVLGDGYEKHKGFIRYSRGLVVTLEGEKSGLWYSFTENVGGGPIKAIEHFKNKSFEEAVIHAAKLSNVSFSDLSYSSIKSSKNVKYIPPSLAKLKLPPPPGASERSKSENDVSPARKHFQTEKDKIETARSLASVASLVTTGSLGGRYLIENRCIPQSFVGSGRLEVYDVPAMTPYSEFLTHIERPEGGSERVETCTSNHILLGILEDADGTVNGVCRTYLIVNDDGVKKLGKFNKGKMKGNGVVIQRGGVGVSDLYLAEGMETACSIASVVDKEATVIAVLAVSNFQNLMHIAHKFQPKRIIFAADNDGINVSASCQIGSAIKSFKNVFPKVPFYMRIPVLEGVEKCDWNDVLKNLGENELRNMFLERPSDTKLNWQLSA